LIRFSLILNERVFKLAVLLIKKSLVILGIGQLSLQLILFVDELRVLVGQGLVQVLSNAQLLKKISDLLLSLMEPGSVTNHRELIVNRDDCIEAVLEFLKVRLGWLTLDDAVAAGQQRVDDFIYVRVIDVVFVLEIQDNIFLPLQLCFKLCDFIIFFFDMLRDALSDFKRLLVLYGFIVSLVVLAHPIIRFLFLFFVLRLEILSLLLKVRFVLDDGCLCIVFELFCISIVFCLQIVVLFLQIVSRGRHIDELLGELSNLLFLGLVVLIKFIERLGQALCNFKVHFTIINASKTSITIPHGVLGFWGDRKSVV